MARRVVMGSDPRGHHGGQTSLRWIAERRDGWRLARPRSASATTSPPSRRFTYSFSVRRPKKRRIGRGAGAYAHHELLRHHGIANDCEWASYRFDGEAADRRNRGFRAKGGRFRCTAKSGWALPSLWRAMEHAEAWKSAISGGLTVKLPRSLFLEGHMTKSVARGSASPTGAWVSAPIAWGIGMPYVLGQSLTINGTMSGVRLLAEFIRSFGH